MKKILIMLVFLILVGCSEKKDEFEAYNDDFNLPKGWQEKSGARGDYYSDFKDVVFVKNIEDGENFQEHLHNGLNFYRPADFRLINDWNIDIKQEDDNLIFSIITGNEEYSNIKGKVFNISTKPTIVAVSTKNEENFDELYENIFEK